MPRVNTVAGITDEHIQKWGWKLNEDGWVNFPDWQMRIYRNKEEIYWIKPVHEQLKGYTKFANLPAEEKFALYHPKNIASCLYLGMMTDTGSFQYSSVTSRTHEIISKLKDTESTL